MIANPVLRRLQGLELLLVLAVFPLGSACQAVVDLIQRIQTHQTVISHDLPAVNGPWLIVALTVVEQIGFTAVAGLVCYLLCRSGEGIRAINLGRTRLRMDMALLLPVFVIVMWIPQSFGHDLLHWVHLNGFFLYPSPVQLPLGALTTAQVALRHSGRHRRGNHRPRLSRSPARTARIQCCCRRCHRYGRPSLVSPVLRMERGADCHLGAGVGSDLPPCTPPSSFHPLSHCLGCSDPIPRSLTTRRTSSCLLLRSLPRSQ